LIPRPSRERSWALPIGYTFIFENIKYVVFKKSIHVSLPLKMKTLAHSKKLN
jgi:hypothetical protein